MNKENLNNAKNTKNDEFYTQYHDIQKEIEAYLEFNANAFRRLRLVRVSLGRWGNRHVSFSCLVIVERWNKNQWYRYYAVSFHASVSP